MPVRLVSAAGAAAVFLVSWGLLHHGFYARDQIVDTPVYERYGEAMTDGQVRGRLTGNRDHDRDQPGGVGARRIELDGDREFLREDAATGADRRCG